MYSTKKGSAWTSMTVRAFESKYMYHKPSDKIVPIEIPLDSSNAHFQYNTKVFSKFGPKRDPPPPKKYKRFNLPKKTV